jgi:DNA-binding PadR family transcriptional regulator
MAKKALQLLTETMFYVLLAFNKQDMCGTDIAEYITKVTKGRIVLGPGTLYTILAKFEEEKLIVETSVSGRKRTYTITGKGRAAYRKELDRLRLCINNAESEDA